ncbi:MAG: DUF3662 and FHA domain-containing protein [Acidimicrobiales bacterium]
MVLRNLEDRLEQAVEGMFARLFRSGLQPIEVGRRLVKVVDAERAFDSRGMAIAPNRFTVELATSDYDRFITVNDALTSEFAATIREHAAAEQLRFLGRVMVELVDEPSLTVGRCRVRGSFDETTGSSVTPAYLELPNGSRLELGPSVVSIGRANECTLTLVDTNASRHHADLQPEGDTYRLVDLNSTNGTRVNGQPITSRLLADGDELTFGTVSVRFRLL